MPCHTTTTLDTTNNDGLHHPDTLVSNLPNHHPPPTHLHTLPPEIHVDLTYIPANEDIPLQIMPTLRKTIRLHCLAKDAIQGDTGANCSATNNPQLLWNYKPLDTPIPITTYQDHNNNSSTRWDGYYQNDCGRHYH
jgi:hypothetical protein